MRLLYMKKILATILLLTFTACTSRAIDNKDKNKLSVTTTFYPLTYLAQEIGGDYVKVIQVTPSGIEPHDYEPTPQDLAMIQNSKLFIANGYGVDSWADNISGLRAAEKVDGKTVMDPHVWLNPKSFQEEATAVRDAFMQTDPIHTTQYKLNATGLLGDLIALDKEYSDGLANCKIRKIITSHDAFRYMAKEYNFESLPIAGFSPEAEPSPKRLAELADLAKKNNIKHIFFETLVSPKLSETLAQEVGAESLLLNPIEGLTAAEEAKSEDYLILMQKNLKNLRTAMQCQ